MSKNIRFYLNDRGNEAGQIILPCAPSKGDTIGIGEMRFKVKHTHFDCQSTTLPARATLYIEELHHD